MIFLFLAAVEDIFTLFEVRFIFNYSNKYKYNKIIRLRNLCLDFYQKFTQLLIKQNKNRKFPSGEFAC